MKKLVPLKSVYAFIAVAETGSMTDAARVLYVSHSAVSQAIKSLEQLVNKPLFQRVGRRVVLNAAGKRYYRKVAPALEQVIEATEELAKTPNEHRITLNMVNSLAMHWWIPRVPDFQAFAPSLDIRISTLTGPFDLEQEGVDIALVHGKPNEWDQYYSEKLGDDDLVLVCSPTLLKNQSELSVQQLVKQNPTIGVFNLRRQHDWQVWCDNYQIPLPTFHSNLTFDVSIQAVQAAIRSLGVLVTHRLFVKDDISHGMLVELGDPVANPHQGFYFVCPKNKLKQESVLKLRTWLRHEFTRSETTLDDDIQEQDQTINQ
ncbi:LysR family transcriptional regulator, glycine cleavage system transcriptional activator [Vibrio crassostreae]|uniref:Putative Bacterial regulator, LysR family n=1 Tax=Vibrio crassostreae TaxID=246167 RepID=A0A822N183_9VIBR|nr:LysR substrate-binding domain-containing protein [Vibrio crassostreae]MDH5950931.1 LysR substrate-binding domain-containing protein [Vibrio crassostreae]TCN12542.1 DNA-binding transcriptional LysR family regulator [Vibrio crassostreae]TCU11550.1 DNA-binding transcriptional LysR family regulator [Vibrio crassostreae]CAK1855030.1 LysR family transcriptional regulator, glycine cleavage system transcriptional activator [Vibrio crassostreae]CAK1866011.1 LysR family transcriptional regulator, gly